MDGLAHAHRRMSGRPLGRSVQLAGEMGRHQEQGANDATPDEWQRATPSRPHEDACAFVLGQEVHLDRAPAAVVPGPPLAFAPPLLRRIRPRNLRKGTYLPT